ncbi:MAG: sarcosine oxidase subunit delta family protein [Gammaproteobacteria bacterium]|nr:sarcosine oxidase subunit delta family protein [Gammaproteobacteria bacterium]
MLLLQCPHCLEARSEEEFDYAGEAHIQRPATDVSDAEWADYLYFRSNPQGRHCEMWVHTAGCRRYFNVVRDTVSYDVLAVYPIGERERESLVGKPPP